jgi:hypothetical protein
MPLDPTKYPNIERDVSGTVTVDPQDSVLRCLTTVGAITINLDTFTSGYWSSQYKLYVTDYSNLAATNNITINAPTGFTINNASSVTINVNGGSILIRIGADTKYTGTLNYTPAANSTDTGWLDLQGFSFVTSTSLVPQYRVISKQIYFRRNLVIPLADDSANLVNYATDATYGTTYAGTSYVSPFTGTGGVTTFDGGCTFNNGASVLQDSSHYPDATYESAWIIANRIKVMYPIAADPSPSAPANPATMGLYHSPYIIKLTQEGVLTLQTLNARERSVYTSQNLGLSILRNINSKSIYNDYAMDFNSVVDSAGNDRTLNGMQLLGYDAAQVENFYGQKHYTTMDPANETQFGGFTVPLMNFQAFKA